MKSTLTVGHIDNVQVLVPRQSIIGYIGSYARGVINPKQLKVIAKEIISDARRQKLFDGPVIIDFVGEPERGKTIYPNENKYIEAIANIIKYIIREKPLPTWDW